MAEVAVQMRKSKPTSGGSEDTREQYPASRFSEESPSLFRDDVDMSKDLCASIRKRGQYESGFNIGYSQS